MIFIVALLWWGLAPAASAQRGSEQVADLVVENAVVYTANAKQPKARALAVKGARILAVGEDVRAHTGPDTRRIDAKGRTVLPGFIDCHGHLGGLGDSLEILDLRASGSAAEVAAAVGKAAAARAKGEWIRGRSWDQTRWPGGQFPTAADLDRVAPDHPVYLSRVDGHAAWVNSKALEMADVGPATPDPPGGRILRDAGGKPTGVLVDRAMSLVSRRIPSPGPAQTRALLERAMRECVRLGLTTVHDAGVSAEQIAAYRALESEGRMPLRVYAMIGGAGKTWEQWLARGPLVGEYLTVRSIKLVADGALGSRGAAMKEPYSDEPGSRGLTILTRDQIEKVARQAAAKGFQVNTHAIGDAANRNVLDAYAAVLRGKNDRRFRIEHAQIVSLGDFPLFAEHSVVASIQATHATSDMRWAEQRIGPKRVEGAYAWRRFLDLGIRLANGSDFPVESPDPLLGFHATVTRQDAEGHPPGGWRAAEKLTREEALLSWTLWGAWAAFEEKHKGSLEVGKLADFVLLSRDVMQVPAKEILQAKVELTVVGGRVVHDVLVR